MQSFPVLQEKADSPSAMGPEDVLGLRDGGLKDLRAGEGD